MSQNLRAFHTSTKVDDATALMCFLNEGLEGCSPTERAVVYVRDTEGRELHRATFVQEVLTDGSTVVNLILSFKD